MRCCGIQRKWSADIFKHYSANCFGFRACSFIIVIIIIIVYILSAKQLYWWVQCNPTHLHLLAKKADKPNVHNFPSTAGKQSESLKSQIFSSGDGGDQNRAKRERILDLCLRDVQHMSNTLAWQFIRPYGNQVCDVHFVMEFCDQVAKSNVMHMKVYVCSLFSNHFNTFFCHFRQVPWENRITLTC